MKIRSAVTALLTAAALLLPPLTLTAQAAATLPPILPTAPVHIVAAGDIACGKAAPTVTSTTCQQKATGKLAASLNPKYVLPLGDLVYAAGSLANLMYGYDPAWGALKTISNPIPGSHEHGSAGLAGYYRYWGARATPQEPTCKANCKGYYSYNTGSWHILALNSSSCLSETTGICGDFTAQVAWIKADLAAHPTKCTLAYIHNPLWSYGTSATAGVRPLFKALYAGGVDVVVAAHDHNYQRFAAQTITGRKDPSGLTEIIAGTGGVNQMPVGSATPPKNRVAAFRDFGLLDLQLGQGKWTSSFHSISGAVRDPAVGVCH